MSYGYSTRAVKSPTASSGAHARVAGGRDKPGSGDRGAPGRDRWGTKFVPLSVFFARMDAEAGEGGDPDAVYGYQSKKKRQGEEPKAPKDKETKEKNADANRQTTGRSGSGTTAGDAGTANQALNTAGEKNEDKERSFVPPKDVQAAARRGLELRRKTGKGGLTSQEAGKEGIGSGVQRAANLSNGNAVSLKVIKMMRGFFARHEKNKGKPGDMTPGRIAWLLWGGNAGRAWANKVLNGLEEASVGQGLPVRSGASHVASGGNIHGTGAGNFATAPVPLGLPLQRRAWLLKFKKKKKRKKPETE